MPKKPGEQRDGTDQMTPEEIRKLKPGQATVACRKARGTPGATVYPCQYCKVKIEASPRAVQQIAAGATVACVECAAILTDTAAATGKLAGIYKSVDVEAFLASGRRATPAGEHLAIMAELFPYKRKQS